MHFSTIFVLAAAFSGAIAAPMPQDGTVSIAGNNNRNTRTRTTTTATPTTVSKTTTTPVITTTPTVAPPLTTVSAPPAPPAPTSPPKCKNGRQTFNLIARSLESDAGNFLKSAADGQFIVDLGGPAGFSTVASSNYFLQEQGFLTKSDGSGAIATVKTTAGGVPHLGNIVFLTPEQSIASNFSPLRCSNLASGRLTCVANNGDRKVAQVCGKFIDFENVRNNNCQDVIAFEVARTCEF